MFESEVTDIVRKWLDKRGYVTKKEVRLFYREADIVGLKKPNKFIAVEVKGDGGDLIRGIGQAISYGICVNESYLAIEEKMMRDFRGFLDKIPIGVIIINKNKVSILKKSTKFDPDKKWKTYLKELFEKGKSKRPIKEGPYGTKSTETPEMKRLKKSLTKESLWYWILILLSRKPYHAYILRTEIKYEFGFMPGNVTCYKVLYFLKKGGYVTDKKIGRKNMYSITQKGRKELSKAKMFLENVSEIIDK